VARQLLGRFDPTGGQTRDSFLKTTHCADGSPCVWKLTQTEGGFRVETQGGDPGTRKQFVRQFPLRDGVETFRPQGRVLDRLARGLGGLRLLRVPWAFDVAAGFVLQQRVRWKVGYTDYRRVALRWGTKTHAGVAFPHAERLAGVPVFQLEAMGIDGKRARALAALARDEATRPFLRMNAAPPDLSRRLLRLPGIGPWTTGMILGYAFGDPDAVPVGDLHLPGLVTSALAGEQEGDDSRMLELLEPYRGQRFRVIRMLLWATRHAPHVLALAPGRPGP
jgi:3-methyladenine DNA glycosylase/8-oxoguanine DNA glycosylase